MFSLSSDNVEFREREELRRRYAVIECEHLALETARKNAYHALERTLLENVPTRAALKACRDAALAKRDLLDRILALAELCLHNRHLLSSGVSKGLAVVKKDGTERQRGRARHLSELLIAGMPTRTKNAR